MKTPLNSIFSRNIHSVRENFVFVIMPYEENLTKIYDDIVKKCVLDKEFICELANHMSTTNPVINDI